MSGPGAVISSDGLVGGDRRDRLIASLAGRLGSWREAGWIVDHVDRRLAENRAARVGSGPVGGEDLEEGDLEEEAAALALRREEGEPLQYVLGRWSFRSLELRVDRRVLVPRPETEQVVEVALAELDRRFSTPTTSPGRRRASTASPVCVDLGTGSGAIALSLVVESMTGGGSGGGGTEVWATDVSAEALAVAASNRTAVLPPRARPRLRLRRGSWYGALPASLVGGVDLIVSNPPYVPAEDVDWLEAVVRDHEPHLALAAAEGSNGVAGLAAIEQVVSGAPRWLRHTGALVVELGPDQAGPAVEVARSSGFRRARIEVDLAGRERMLVAGEPS